MAAEPEAVAERREHGAELAELVAVLPGRYRAAVAPLADRLRPACLADVVGQGHLLGPEGTLVMPSMSDDDEHPFDPATDYYQLLGLTPAASVVERVS